MKKVYWLLALIVTGIAGWFLFFYPVRITRSVKVPYTMFKAGEQLTNARNLVRWYEPFLPADTSGIVKSNDKQLVRSGDYSAEINNTTMYSTLLTAGYKNSKKEFALNAFTDTTASSSSTVTLVYYTNLFHQWFSKPVLEKNAEKSLENLREYMTDTRRFYGFEIQMVPVEDTVFLFSRVTVPLAERKEATKKLFEKLIAAAEKWNAAYNGTRIYYSQKTDTDITLFASIGITNLVDIPANSDIELKRMPFRKNLLVANYQGAFGQSNKAIRALEAFITDHSLTNVAIPFQKFMSDGYEFDDDQVVQLKIYYPVF